MRTWTAVRGYLSPKGAKFPELTWFECKTPSGVPRCWRWELVTPYGLEGVYRPWRWRRYVQPDVDIYVEARTSSQYRRTTSTYTMASASQNCGCAFTLGLACLPLSTSFLTSCSRRWELRDQASGEMVWAVIIQAWQHCYKVFKNIFRTLTIICYISYRFLKKFQVEIPLLPCSAEVKNE